MMMFRSGLPLASMIAARSVHSPWLSEQAPSPGDTSTESAVLFTWMAGPSRQSGTPSAFASRLSSTPGHWSTQLSLPSPSSSASGTPQPQVPGAVLLGSLGQPSKQSITPSPSVSLGDSHTPVTALFGFVPHGSRPLLPTRPGPKPTPPPGRGVVASTPLGIPSPSESMPSSALIR